MTSPSPKPPLRKAPIFTPYVVVWSLLGTLGIGYLGLAVVSPEMLQDLTPGYSARFEAGSPSNIHAMGRVATEVGAIRESLAQLELDVSKLKTDVSGQEEFGKTLETQVIALEQRVKAQERPVEAQIPAAPQSGDAPRDTANAEHSSPSARDTAPPLTVINANDAGSARTAKEPLVTGSVTNAAKSAAIKSIDFGPAVIKPVSKPIGLRLASGASVDSLRLSWSLLSDRHSESLAKLEARFVAGGDDASPNYDLVAGPVKSKAEAVKICKDLAAKNVSCKVGEFTGEAL